jgi:hypothetical protein
MLRANLVIRIVETDEVNGAYIDRADAEPHSAVVDQVKVYQAFERRLQRSDIVVAEGFGTAVRIQKRGRHTRLKKAGRAAEQNAQRADLIDDAAGELVVEREIGHPERRNADGFPELPQSLDAPLRRIAGDQRQVHCADRNAGDPVGVQIRLCQDLIDAGLVRAEGAAALQDQRNTLEGRTLDSHMRFPPRRPLVGHDKTFLFGVVNRRTASLT